MPDASYKRVPSKEPGAHQDDLINRIKKDDYVAFKQLFEIYYKELVLYARTHLPSNDLAEGIVQDVFVRIWENRANWNPQNALRASLYAQTRNASLSYLRTQRRRNDLLRSWSKSEPTSDTADNRYQVEELSFFANKAVETLPPKRKEIYCLSRHYGLSYKEIAALLDISTKTVEAQMGKALKYLREQLRSFR